MSLTPYNPNAAANPSSIKRKSNVLTGQAEEIVLSDTTFIAQHRTFQSLGYARDPGTGALVGNLAQAAAHGGTDFTSYRPSKAISEEWRNKRQKKGDAGIVSGENAYKGPWAKYENKDDFYDEEYREGDELASDEEWVEEGIAPAGTSEPAMPKASTAYATEEAGAESTEFHGSQQYDYQGRTYMHIPQDLDIDLRNDEPVRNYIPSKLIHTWRGHTKPITSLSFFPGSGHLLLSSSADTKMKIWDVYHERELLRTFSGHTKSITSTNFNHDGTRIMSGSYDKQMKLWDTETGQCINRFSTGKIPHVLVFHPGSPGVDPGNEFFAGMSDNKIVSFDIRSGEKTQEYDHHLGPVNTLTFCDEGRRFITTSDDKSLRCWEAGIPVPIKFVAEPYMFAMNRAALHPAHKWLCLQSADNQIVVYAATDRFRQNRKKSFRGHNNAGYAIDLDISPDGQFVMSGDSGGYVCFWDFKTTRLNSKFVAVEGGAKKAAGGAGAGPVTCCKWHPRETSKVVTAGLSGEIRYWD